MKNEVRNCQNCKQDFTIEEEDFNFYKKIKVPPPTWCSECRMIRRFAFLNTWGLHWRNCDKCGKKNLSIYSPKEKIKVYCPPCWWADDWDGTEYGMDYNPKRPFLDQVREIQRQTPHAALKNTYTTLKNSEYCNDLGWTKDSYFVFWADYCESVFYSSILYELKHSADCLRGFNSELCYESTGFSRNYRVFFSEQSDDCVDVWFSRNCYGCTNCIGCVNLRGATNCIFNVKYSKEEYEQKVKEMGLDKWSNIQKIKEETSKFWLEHPYREYNGDSKNLNVSGEHTYNSKNSKEGFIVNDAENSKWCQFITMATTKDSYDYSGWGNNSTLMYEAAQVGENANSVFFSVACVPDSMNLEYCFNITSGKNNFGCSNLKRKSYCILNKEYSKDEYQKLREKIIEDMKNNPYKDKLGRQFPYGEFFPPEFSKYPYNKSNAMKFFPKTKEQALSEGYKWDEEENPSNLATIKSESLPDTIKETTDDILKEVIECADCKRGYKITNGELGLLRKMNLPLPRECPKCRENKRFDRMTKPKMYRRNCAKCDIEIYTPYSPEDPRIVYCVKDYQALFA